MTPMQKLIATSFLLIASCLVLRAQEPAATPKKTDEPATGVIDGKVVNENGQPMAGAGVFIRAITRLETHEPLSLTWMESFV